MRYVMKQKILSWGDDFTIRDGDGNDAFYVDGKALSFGDKLSFQDMAGNELARIEQKLLSWGPTYELYRGGDHMATVKKKHFTFMRDVFTVDVPGPDDLEATGNIFDREYTFRRHGEDVARVSKAFFSLRDSYGIDIHDGEDDVLILAAAVVIDLVAHDDDD